jgi:hypothetical protein
MSVLILYGSENSLTIELFYGRIYCCSSSTNIRCYGELWRYENRDKLKPQRPRTGDDKEHKQCIAIMGNQSRLTFTSGKRPKGRHKECNMHRRNVWTTVAWDTSEQQRLAVLSSIYEDAEKSHHVQFVARGGTVDGGWIVVMVANHGQSQFLSTLSVPLNHEAWISRGSALCNRPGKPITLQSQWNCCVLRRQVFASIPSGAAKDCHDVNYGRMVMSKVYCAPHQLMGYDSAIPGHWSRLVPKTGLFQTVAPQDTWHVFRTTREIRPP